MQDKREQDLQLYTTGRTSIYSTHWAVRVFTEFILHMYNLSIGHMYYDYMLALLQYNLKALRM